MNPLLYVTILFCVLIGYRRVINERKSFNRRIHWGMYEAVYLLKEGWLMALILSVLSVAIGIVLPVEYIVLVTIVMLIGIVCFYYHAASVVYSFAIAFIIIWLTYMYDWTWHIFNFTFTADVMHKHLLVSVPLLISLLLFAEGQLVKKYAADNASPRLQTTERGLKAVTYLAKRLWILPVFFLIPGSVIPDATPWWPQFTIGEQSFGIVLFPVVIGFQQRARKQLPKQFYPQIGLTMQLLAILVFIEAIIALFFPVIGIAAVLVAIIGRLFISIVYAVSERKGTFAVTPQNEGVVVAAILPESPAEAMGIQVGEVIRRVNGMPVKTEEALYEALQINAAHCRIEVIDAQNEIRIRQHVIFRHDHFRIGLIVLK
jgi:hypothetical protein